MSRQTKSVLMRSNERERLRVAATVTQEREWPQNEPNQGLARMFVIMLLIHVVVIGGVIIYDFVGQPEDAKTAGAQPSAAAKAAAPAPNPAPKVIASEPKSQTQEAPLMTSNISKGKVPEPLTPMQATTMAPALLPDSVLKSGSTTVVDLPPQTPKETVGAPVDTPPAPKQEARVAPKPEPEVRKPEVVKTSKPKEEEPVKATPKPKVEKAVALGAAPKPVMTPSDARKALAKDAKRTTTAPAPATTKKKETATAAPAKKAATPSRHTVAKGDTIYGIARRYKVSEKALMQANGISNPAALRLGKALVIP